MKINEILTESLDEQVLDEMPLPTDWDATQFKPGSTFKARLAYALERAKRLGTGSSRVAMTIEYEGRPTALKIAKNQKGLAQNEVEAELLSDGYIRQLPMVIPIIDYDEENRQPLWIHTELAQKASEKQLCAIMGCTSLRELVSLAQGISGKSRFTTYQGVVASMKRNGLTDEQIETATEYANTLVDLNNSFDVEIGDFITAANWGLYQGRPVIIDLGFTTNVATQYYKR
jgi:hypothetical protein